MSKPFYKTVPLNAMELAEAMANAKNQDEKILLFMRNRPTETVTALTIHEIYPHWPITSVRRSLTNLEQAGHIIREDYVKGDKGMKIGSYRLATPGEMEEKADENDEVPERLAQLMIGKIILNRLVKEQAIEFTGKRPKKFKRGAVSKAALRLFVNMEDSGNNGNAAQIAAEAGN